MCLTLFRDHIQNKCFGPCSGTIFRDHVPRQYSRAILRANSLHHFSNKCLGCMFLSKKNVTQFIMFLSYVSDQCSGQMFRLRGMFCFRYVLNQIYTLKLLSHGELNKIIKNVFID